MMRRTAYGRSTWMIAFAACVAAATVAAPARAQSPRPLGAVLTVPVESFGAIAGANGEDYIVTMLQISQRGGGAPASPVITIRISPRPGTLPTRSGPTLACWLPRTWVETIQQMNGDAVRLPEPLGAGNAPKVLAEVSDSGGTHEGAGARFLLLPLDLVEPVRQLNGQMFRVLLLPALTTGERLALLEPGRMMGLKLPPGTLPVVSQLNASLALPAVSGEGQEKSGDTLTFRPMGE